MDTNDIQKGKALPIGTEKTRGGNIFRKEATGWVYVRRATTSAAQHEQNQKNKKEKIGQEVRKKFMEQNAGKIDKLSSEVLKLSREKKTNQYQIRKMRKMLQDGKVDEVQAMVDKFGGGAEKKTLPKGVKFLGSSGDSYYFENSDGVMEYNSDELDEVYGVSKDDLPEPEKGEKVGDMEILHSKKDGSKIVRTSDGPITEYTAEEWKEVAPKEEKKAVWSKVSDDELDAAYSSHSGTQHADATEDFKDIHKELLRREKDPKSKFYMGDEDEKKAEKESNKKTQEPESHSEMKKMYGEKLGQEGKDGYYGITDHLPGLIEKLQDALDGATTRQSPALKKELEIFKKMDKLISQSNIGKYL